MERGLFTLEVGARGYVASGSFYEFTSEMGFSQSDTKALRRKLSHESLRCSYVIWINRFNKFMNKGRLTKCYIPVAFLFSQSTTYFRDRVSNSAPVVNTSNISQPSTSIWSSMMAARQRKTARRTPSIMRTLQIMICFHVKAFHTHVSSQKSEIIS